MASNYIPENNPNAPNTITLLSILKAFNSDTNREFPTRFTDVNELLSRHIHPSFEHIDGSPYSNEELGAILTEITRQLLAQKNEILYLHRLLALTIFELDAQGIEFSHKELYNEIKKYL